MLKTMFGFWVFLSGTKACGSTSEPSKVSAAQAGSWFMTTIVGHASFRAPLTPALTMLFVIFCGPVLEAFNCQPALNASTE